MANRTRACAGFEVEAVEGTSGMPVPSVKVKVIETMPCALTSAAVISDTRPAPGKPGGTGGSVVLVVLPSVVGVGPPPTVGGTRVRPEVSGSPWAARLAGALGRRRAAA